MNPRFSLSHSDQLIHVVPQFTLFFKTLINNIIFQNNVICTLYTIKFDILIKSKECC